jgi:hypothetical protein
MNMTPQSRLAHEAVAQGTRHVLQLCPLAVVNVELTVLFICFYSTSVSQISICVRHSVKYECSLGHTETVQDIANPVLWFRLFASNLDMVHEYNHESVQVTLSDYLAHYVPRRAGGNFTGGITHSILSQGILALPKALAHQILS